MVPWCGTLPTAPSLTTMAFAALRGAVVWYPIRPYDPVGAASPHPLRVLRGSMQVVRHHNDSSGGCGHRRDSECER